MKKITMLWKQKFHIENKSKNSNCNSRTLLEAVALRRLLQVIFFAPSCVSRACFGLENYFMPNEKLTKLKPNIVTEAIFGILAAFSLLPLTALAQNSASSHIYEPVDCKRPLEFANAAIDVDDLQSVDFCKELIIIDPTVLRILESESYGYSFRSVFEKLSPVQTHADTFFEHWKNSWDEDQRPTVGSMLEDSWECMKESGGEFNHIKLIAVINRMDLAKLKMQGKNFVVTEPGEGRLIYQLLRKSPDPEKGCSVAYIEKFTVILEFGLPTLDGLDLTESQREWAQSWHRLSNLEETPTRRDYSDSLKEILDKFVVNTQLNQIRTNEQVEPILGNNDWELREYRLSDSGLLEASRLSATPNEGTRLDEPDSESRRELVRELDAKQTQLENGSFNVLDDLPGQFSVNNLIARFEPNEKPAWMDLTGTVGEGRPFFLMSFNTCNGCHHDQQTVNGIPNAQHIRFSRDGPFPSISDLENRNATEVKAELSNFLTANVELGYQLPECRKDEPLLNAPCSNVNQSNFWNEQLMRVCRLEYWLEQFFHCPAEGSAFISENFQDVSEIEFEEIRGEANIPYYRYH